MSERAFTAELMERGLYEIAKEIALKEHVTVEEIGSMSAFSHIVRARLEFVTFLRDRGWSFEAIGTLLGRDRSSIFQMMKRKKK